MASLTGAQTYQLLLVCGMLISGCVNTLSKKAQNDSKSVGWDDNGQPHLFEHPWFQTLVMFLGESICLIGFYVKRCNQYRLEKKGAAEVEQYTRVWRIIFLLPMAMDLLGTTFAGIGLIYLTASVYQMLRGSIIIFTGVLSAIFLKRRLLPYRWVAMIVTATGLLLVGLAGVLSDTQEGIGFDYNYIWGILLVLAGQLMNASQFVLEETFLKKRNFQPLHIVGMEGFFGAWTMALLVLPILFVIPGPQSSPMKHGSFENSIDAILQIIHSYSLAIYVFLYLFSIAFYNFFGLSVTKSLTSVHRTLIDACRTIFVWGADVFIYYVIDKNFGEPWDKYSIIEVAGFVFLVVGTMLYNGVVKIHRLFRYEADVPVTATEDSATGEEEADFPGKGDRVSRERQDLAISEEEKLSLLTSEPPDRDAP